MITPKDQCLKLVWYGLPDNNNPLHITDLERYRYQENFNSVLNLKNCVTENMPPYTVESVQIENIRRTAPRFVHLDLQVFHMDDGLWTFFMIQRHDMRFSRYPYSGRLLCM